MKLRVVRDTFTEKSTTGELYIDGQPHMWTLELPDKNGLPGSCIPQGIYPVVAYLSPKFGRTMPLLQNVPGRSEIEMHWGNTAEDTNGCILLGRTRDTDYIGESRMAFDSFWERFMPALAKEGVSIEIVGGYKQHPADLSLQGDV